MTRVKLDFDSIKLMSLFESLTGAGVRDCILDDKVILIIEENQMGRAIGKNGSNIRKFEEKLRKKVKLAEFSRDVVQFVKNLIYPIQPQDIQNIEGVITINGKDTSTRAMLIGRERKNINMVASIVKRYFDIKEIRVI